MKKVLLLPAILLLSAIQLMAQTTDITDKVTLQAWSDPVTILNDDAKPWNTDNSAYVSSQLLAQDESTTLTVSVQPGVASTFCFDAKEGSETSYLDQLRSRLEVYVDNALWRSVESNVLCRFGGPRFFIDLNPGPHTIRFVVTNGRTNGSKHGLRIGIYGLMQTDRQVHATVTEPGSLGQEILYDVERLSDVRRLKVTGTLNDADWTTIGNMSATLWEIDLSGVTNTAIPNNRFRRDGRGAWDYLNKAVLPAGLTAIGEGAFYRSYVTQMTFPGGLQTIGASAFENSMLEQALLPDAYCSTDAATAGAVFRDVHMLKSLDIGPNVKVLGGAYLQGCISLQGFALPPSVETLNGYACVDCWNNDFGSMSSVKVFSENSMCRTGITAIKLDNVTAINRYALCDNPLLTSVELGDRLYKFHQYDWEAFVACPRLTTFKINSPTVCVYNATLSEEQFPRLTLQVPNYLVNNYKSDANWMKAATIEGFSTAGAAWLHVNDNLTLGARQRMEGRPSVAVANNYIFKIGGEAQQQFAEFRIQSNRWDNQFAQVISTCPNVDVTTADASQFTYHNRWYAFALPYDVCVDDIRAEQGNFAIRYYDGANRAANGTTGSWKDFAAGAVIPAGTGFIYQASANGVWSHFPSHGTSGRKLFSPNAHSTTLAEHAAAVPANQSWNLVGNPYQCYYDAKKMEFNSPITVFKFDGWGGISYTAYSLADDDYILRPNEAFFVQRPEGVEQIGFPLGGKQTVATVVPSQVKAKVGSGLKRRFLVDMTVSDGQQSDRTRVVVNEAASAAYELDCDASKFFGTGLQLYTLDADDTRYAINERPLGEGLVPLGLQIATEGTYTFTLTRNGADRVWLTDTQTGAETDLCRDSYTFHAKAGTDEGRFALRIAAATTGMDELPAADGKKAGIYDLAGRRMEGDAQGLKRGIYLMNGKKVCVK